MALVSATAKRPAEISAFGKAKESQFTPGQRVQSIKFVTLDGTTEHWATFPAEQAKQFEMGQRCYLVPVQRSNKATFDIELDTTTPVQPQIQHQPKTEAPPDNTRHLEPDQKRAIAAWVSGQADLYAYCYTEARRALSPHEVGPDQIQGAASSLFISATRKFNLER
jgi:hypothetical protein